MGKKYTNNTYEVQSFELLTYTVQLSIQFLEYLKSFATSSMPTACIF